MTGRWWWSRLRLWLRWLLLLLSFVPVVVQLPPVPVRHGLFCVRLGDCPFVLAPFIIWDQDDGELAIRTEG